MVEDERTRLLKRRARLDVRLKALSMQERKKKRKSDNRLKYISGALALEQVKRRPEFAAEFAGLVKRYVPRPEDRKLFDDFMNSVAGSERPAPAASEGFADAASPAAPEEKREAESA